MLELGRQIDRYTLEAPIGGGGQGFVYRVRHIQLGTDHALKVVTGGGARMRDRLLQEGRAQARLRHPNIVSVTDVIDVDGDSGLIMEFVPGPPLSVLLAQEVLSFEQIDLLVRGILDGVAHAHRQRFIHRDLKPDNILCAVTERGLVPKIMDFGLVKALAGAEVPASGMRQTRSGAMMGTAQYMSPEQVRSTKDVDERSDVWALGVIVYEMLTRRLPFDGADLFEIFAAVTRGEYVPIDDLRADVPPRMREAVERAIVVDPDARLESVEAMRTVWGEARPEAAGAAVRGARATAWDPEMLERYTVRSLPSFEPTGQQETWLPSMDKEAHSTWRTSDPPAPSEPGRGRPGAWLLVGLGSGLGLAGLALFGALGLWAASRTGAGGQGTDASELAAPAPAIAAPVPSDESITAPAPELVAPVPTAGPVPAPAVEPQPAPAVEPQPAPRPRPAPRPSPAPVAAPTPVPAAAPVPEPAPAPAPVGPALGTFTVRGTLGAGDSAYLAPTDGGRPIHPGSAVPAGEYSVVLVVGGRSEGTVKIQVETGQSVVATCDAGSVFCRASTR